MLQKRHCAEQQSKINPIFLTTAATLIRGCCAMLHSRHWPTCISFYCRSIFLACCAASLDGNYAKGYTLFLNDYNPALLDSEDFWQTRRHRLSHFLFIYWNNEATYICLNVSDTHLHYIWTDLGFLLLLTCRTHWETTPSGTSGNFWHRSCKTWMSIWWLPWAIRVLPGLRVLVSALGCQSWQQTAFISNIFCNEKKGI